MVLGMKTNWTDPFSNGFKYMSRKVKPVSSLLGDILLFTIFCVCIIGCTCDRNDMHYGKGHAW